MLWFTGWKSNMHLSELKLKCCQDCVFLSGSWREDTVSLHFPTSRVLLNPLAHDPLIPSSKSATLCFCVPVTHPSHCNGTGLAASHLCSRCSRERFCCRGKRFVPVPVTCKDGGIMSESLSYYLSIGRGFYLEGEGKQNREIRRGGWKVLYMQMSWVHSHKARDGLVWVTLV